MVPGLSTSVYRRSGTLRPTHSRVGEGGRRDLEEGTGVRRGDVRYPTEVRCPV